MEAKICPKCCVYTIEFDKGMTDCIKCMSYEPKVRKEKKKYPKLNKQVFNEKFNDHRARVKEDIERKREKRRKQRLDKIFF